jgi:hypothetical protein
MCEVPSQRTHGSGRFRFLIESIIVALKLCAVFSITQTAVGQHIFTNPTRIADSQSESPIPCIPYPSSITVSNVPGFVTKVNVTLNKVWVDFSPDANVLLVGPNGRAIMLLSDAPGDANHSISNMTLTFDDDALSSIPGDPILTSGSYKPTNFDSMNDSIPSPAPVGPYAQTLAIFNGTNPNGSWALYVVNDRHEHVWDYGGVAILEGWTLTITASTQSTDNPIDQAEFFVRQQYLDFLEREPEPAGLQFYLDILNGCDPADTECIKYTRGGLSANFFRSPEFGRKGAYIANLFNIVIGQRPKTVAELNDPTKVERPHYGEFMADLATLSTPNDDPVLTNQKKDQLASAWLARSEVQAILPSSLSNQQFVQKLESIAGVTLANESTLIANLNNGSQTRAQVLRAIAESNEIVTKFYIPNFVTMEYLGYLRRDPEDCHLSSDPESCGYIFHNRRFNTPGANPDLIENIIVRGFIESPEYRHRFDGGCAGCWDY